MRYPRRVGVGLLIVALPAAIYALHALRFGSWIVDDAGITFAYARSFAQGYGLVSQPGMPPVEGYSNFSWLLLLSPFYALRIFDPVVTPKLISILLVAAAFGVLYNALKPLAVRGWIAFAAFTLTALNTSFVAWTISGLENALYVFLVSVLLWGSVRAAQNGNIALRNGLWLGIVAALVGMTRPDGVAYMLAVPAVLLLARKPDWKRKLALLGLYALAFGALFGLFIGFRAAYFGALMPNTYAMKGGPELKDVIDVLTLQPAVLAKARDLLASVSGALADALPMLLVGGSLLVLLARRWTIQAWALVVFAGCALGIYLLLPPDWMGEYRFATVFFPMLYLFAALIVASLAKLLPARAYPVIMALGTGAAVIASFNLYQPRTDRFNRDPTVPLEYIRNSYADRFNGYKQALGLDDASVLIPDVGGMLLYADLDVYDLAGLTDRTVAQYLGQKIYRPGFYAYTFETIRPTFIHTHAFWTQLTRLEDDPRFAQMYVPICAYTDPWVRQTYGQSRQSGDFVRREIAEAHPDVMQELRQGLDDRCDPLSTG
jgi:hypothetical protein